MIIYRGVYQVFLPLSLEDDPSLLLRRVDGAGDDITLDIYNMDDSSAARIDSKLLAQHIASTQKTVDATEAPLLTHAIRQLEKAKKERVYSTCIVRIK